jgi:uncharacterized membrane protein (UPF0127 family)
MSYGKPEVAPHRWHTLVQRCTLVLLCGLLLGCSSPLTEAGEPAPANPDSEPVLQTDLSPAEALSGPGQLLPVTAQADMAGELIDLEVASTREQQSLGLMYRTQLADNRGMLFPFEFPRRAAFWMKNVPIALDMVFLLDGRIQAIAENVPPCLEDPCAVYGPGSLLVDQVIELRGGRAAELGLQPGDRVTITGLQPTSDR